MSAFVEVRIKGDARALIEAGSIAGIITSPNARLDVIATPERPFSVILRGGAQLEVYGESPAMLITRAQQVRTYVREKGLDIKADLIDAPDPAMYGGQDAATASPPAD